METKVKIEEGCRVVGHKEHHRGEPSAKAKTIAFLFFTLI
ncbi:hypothetical protein SR187_0790 [Streptococcus ruminantium]|uniref:Uncharacterized protein n=1 Tax=Streptococcus ruminantium TaxID=1917441 RepID=A0A2Z5TK35_9STRE|nr:hypothetical protein SR187_0790 [Streptococcus ruminantium]